MRKFLLKLCGFMCFMAMFAAQVSASAFCVLATNAQLLSVTPKAETARFSLRSAFRLNREKELPDDVVEHKYIAEYLNEDGTITTEEFSTFEVIDID